MTRAGFQICTALALLVAGCTSGPSEQTRWVLSTVNGAPYPARATLRFAHAGEVYGQAPCNSYRAPLTKAAPAFDVGTVISTRAICPDGAAEQQYFFLLSRMERSDMRNGRLTLSNAAGQSMVFKAGG